MEEINIAVSFERAIGANGRIIDVEQPEELPGTTEFESTTEELPDADGEAENE